MRHRPQVPNILKLPAQVSLLNSTNSEPRELHDDIFYRCPKSNVRKKNPGEHEKLDRQVPSSGSLRVADQTPRRQCQTLPWIQAPGGNGA